MAMTWAHLRADTTADVALATIGDLVRKLDNVKTGETDPVRARDGYLSLVEDAEHRLATIFRDASASRNLLTSRYWRIRDITDNTLRPWEMIRPEVEEQIRILAALRTQLEYDANLLPQDRNGHVAILDTNVYLHGQQFDNVPWHELLSLPTVTILLPQLIVDELDRRKDAGAKAAAAVLRWIDKRFASESPFSAVPLRDGVDMQILPEPFDHVRYPSNDAEQVRQAQYWSSVAPGSLRLITHDRGMRIRASVGGIATTWLPDRYLREQV